MQPSAYVWSKAPFIRFLLPLIAGILLQWHMRFFAIILGSAFFACVLLLLVYAAFSLTTKYKWRIVNGLVINSSLLLFGAILVWLNDVRNTKNQIGHYNGGYFIATLQEPLIEKENSFKAVSNVEWVYENDSCKKVTGKIILYFKKDSAVTALHYGSQIIFKKTLQEIKNPGNPGGFDYKRYCLFNGITHQVYLNPQEFKQLSKDRKGFLNEVIFKCRTWVLVVLKKYISGEKERGLAEALLIGYKDDLDKKLVTSYTNTGVVHIIAISGLHLGLIYWILLFLTKPLKKNKRLTWIRLAIIILSLWLFSLLAGGQPSVLRSAVMFSCIALGEVLSRRAYIYNTLALSAFILLCYNPFWLWDVGFQLSYAAVISIIIFFRPIYNWFYFSNKAIDFLWKPNAVTLAAQLLTLPISLYYFHQMPTLFLFTNIIAVPLSSVILIGEIILCAFFFLEPVAFLIGAILKRLIYLMNAYIERLELVSFSVWNGLSINLLQTILLTGVIIGICYWFMEKKKPFVWMAVCLLCAFMGIRSWSFIQSTWQKKLIVYNIPRYQAIDVVAGRQYHFIGDSALLYDETIKHFYLEPSRIMYRVAPAQSISPFAKEFVFENKRIVIIDKAASYQQKQKIDVLILSKNPKLYISTLCQSISINQIVIDGSVPVWKARLWKRDCDSLHIPCHDVNEKGAFIMNL